MFGGETPLQGISTSRGLLLPLAAIAAYILQGWQVGLSWFTALLPCSKISSFPALHSVAECSFSHLFPIFLRALEVRIQRTPLYWLHVQRGCTWESEFAHTKEEDGETTFWFGLVLTWFLVQLTCLASSCWACSCTVRKKGHISKDLMKWKSKSRAWHTAVKQVFKKWKHTGCIYTGRKTLPRKLATFGKWSCCTWLEQRIEDSIREIRSSPSWVSLLAKSVFWP